MGGRRFWSARDAIRGFYAVLDRDDIALARTLLDAGTRVIQLRVKPRGGPAPSTSELVRIGLALRRVCDTFAAALVVNDRVDVALAVYADGVHLGQTDLPLAEARRAARAGLWFGVSTHDLGQVRAACAAGADYLGFGPVFATSTKANPDPVQGIDGLAAAVRAAGDTPVVAIGGVTPGHAAALYGAGAADVCAISAVNDAADVRAAAVACQRD